MTAQDNDLVQSVAADQPATIAPASRRDPIEDADASFTRKRPRLHGSNSLCAMSTEAHTPDNHVEMTIRSHPPSSPVRAGDDHDHSHTGDVAASSPSPAPVHSPILIPSSDDEGASPPVMLVNDEDDDEDSKDKAVSPRVMVVDDDNDEDDNDVVGLALHMNPEDHFCRFPYSHVGSYTSVVRDLAQHVQDIDNDIDAAFFLGLSQWLVNLPDPSADDMQGFYVSKAAFWDDFGLLVHKVLSRRVSFTRHNHDHDHRLGDAFYSFLSAYVRTSSFLLLVDVLLISRPRPDDIYPLPLISQKHLRHLHTILRSDKAPAYHMVSKEYSVDIRKMVLRLQQDFIAANGARNLLRLATDAILQVPIGTQNHIAVFTSPVLVALGSSIFRSAITSSAHDRSEFSRSTLLFLEKYMDDLFNLSRTAEASIARDLVQHFHALLFELCLWDKDIEADLVVRFLDFRDPDSPTTSSPTETNPRTEQQDEYCQDPGSLAALVANAWKFKILRKYLMKGKMDLRVMSIGMMDSGLVEIFKQYSDHDTVPNHPVMNYLSDFLIEGKVVEYIISVDSHPQILQRSGNIIGFLVVNHRWTDNQADSIWKTIATNPDPRVVSATLTMMRAILHLMRVTDHLYLCTKLCELPISRYTINMLRFLHELSVKVVERATAEDYAMRDRRAKPWNVCVRVICDTASQKETDKELLDLHNEAIEHLRGLAPHVPLNERLAIYRECADHISNHSEKATGSVKVIYTLASSLHTGDGFFFQQNQDVTRKILEEIPWLVETEKNAEPSAYQPLSLRYRLELLALMICRAGPAMPAELFPTLWDHTVGSHAISNNARDWAWAQLFQTIKLIPDNEYCRQLVSSYLSKMDPCFYTPGMFEFVANYNFPTIREIVTTDDGVKTVLQIPGADLLWSMVLYSPEGSVEDRAARLLASRYVHINEAEGVTLADVEAAHVALVEKCMHEIRDACKTIREPCSDDTIPTVSDAIRHEKEGRCRRIILFQKLLLERLRQKPEFNRAKRADSKIDEMDIPYGDAITIRFQCANGDRQAVSMGPDHTVDDLYRRLCYVSGYTKLNLFAKGHRVDVAAQAEEKLSDVDFGGQLLLQKAPEAKVTRPLSGSVAGSSVFESTVTKYFDELFSLMDSNDTISQLLFDYLSFFPARNNIPDSVMADAASSEGLFPPGRFFQARYAALALQDKLREQIRNSSMDERFLGKAVQHLNGAILNEKLIGGTISSLQELQLAAVLVTVLLDFLRERPSPDVSAGYFSDPVRLADRLMSILSMALETNEDATVIQDCYGAIIEASLHSRAVWEAFVGHPETPRLHDILLLEDSRQFVREHVAKKIASVCGGDLPSTCPLAKGEVAIQFWTAISAIIPSSVRHSTQSQQLFGIADHVFRAQDEYKRDENLLRAWLAQWSDLLLDYEHKEVVGREDTDFVVFGLTKLLLCCILSLKSFKLPINAGNVMEQIFKKYIFTKSSPAIGASQLNVPILQSHSRREIYDLMLALVDDSSTYSDLLRLAGEVELEDCETALATLSVDRSMEVRSSTGYVGLYNPRAICYANSLLTQLFMNLNFRKFMLGLELQESNGSQKLLLETQRLFTNMQHSFRRSADPRSFAACVKNSDLMPIDISVQMDADEFYNSLFDQWERQLIKEESKQEFRSFYGGQTLNQIKSKECEHVSERSEPFFAVQCDVVGKSTLQESLQAFVSGDVMEGDNKYKCESCDRYVDAVKRTCFKEVPDNLIFHLKRFEFDLADFSRRKVHDHFEFPPCIDINAYHVNSLSNPTKAHDEDIFDLVGVLVHTGTCEHGHYYSYIRERPSPAGSAAPTWVEFDDSNVVPFDPADIAYRTFGGMTDDTYNRMPKQYSAYMLFYQRRTAIEEDQRKWVTSTNERTLKVPAPQALKQEVDVNNALIIQEYCQFDSNHTKFLRQLHAMSRTINHGSCSEDHAHEKQSLQIVLTHLAHIAWRHTTSDLFTETLLQLRRSVLPCAMCCNIFLKHFATDEGALFNMLVRCPHAKVRSQIRSFLVDCLKVSREKEPTLYGLEGTENDMDSDYSTITKDGLLVDITQRLRQTADDSYQSIRGWDDFYLTLTQVVEIGHAEITVFLNHGFLDFCIKLLSIHVHRRLQDDYPEFWRILSKKVGIYNRLIQFFSTLLSHMDTSLPLVPSTLIENRGATLGRERLKFPLTHRERQMLFYWDPELKAIAVLDKAMEMFDLTKVDAEYFYPGDIVKTMIGWTDPHAQSNLFKTINDGVGLDPPFCDAYVRAALSFCETSATAESVTRLITTVSKAIASANRLEEERLPNGIAVLDFFIGLLKADNEALFEQRHPYVFFYWVMARSRIWAPALLLNPLESVRQSAELLVSELYKDHDWPTDMVAFKWRSLRELLGEMMQRIIFEKDAGMLRIHMTPLISCCQFLLRQIFELVHSEDPDPNLDMYRDDVNDSARIYAWQTDIEPRLHSWPQDDSRLSAGDLYDQSDFGSESDVEEVAGVES